MAGDYFLKMIKTLRRQEEVVLYNNILLTTVEEDAAVVAYLQEEYHAEAFTHPCAIPAFDEAAALWAAKTVYVASQLMLYRKHRESELNDLLPVYSGSMDMAAILSADLCLRFMPDMLKKLELIDPADRLNSILATLMAKWHYSGVRYKLEVDQLDFTLIANDDCMTRIYANRITRYKKLTLAVHPVFKPVISGNLGNFGKEYWNEFKNAIATNE